jgi:hypothetical protein
VQLLDVWPIGTAYVCDCTVGKSTLDARDGVGTPHELPIGIIEKHRKRAVAVTHVVQVQKHLDPALERVLVPSTSRTLASHRESRLRLDVEPRVVSSASRSGEMLPSDLEKVAVTFKSLDQREARRRSKPSAIQALARLAAFLQ